MDKYTIDESQYKNGYAKGYEDGKRDSANGVVRCKDCLYYCTSWYGAKYCNRKQLDGSYVEMSNLSDDDFCSYAERKENEQA